MENYRIAWRYEKYSPETKFIGDKSSIKMSNNRGLVERDMTICYITTETKDVIGKGIVKQHYKDVPNRKIAMKESFKRAVEQITNREVRTYLWEQFKTRSPKCINC
jgi:hypothetical protein